MKNRVLSLLVLSLLVIAVPFVFAQDTTPEPTSEADPFGIPFSTDAIFADLSTRLGTDVTINNVGAFNWEQQVFNDGSLGCPQEGQMYTQAIVDGYIFTFEYGGVTYDYRVPQTVGAAPVFCSEAEGSLVDVSAVTPEADDNGLIVCDSTLILLTLIASNEYGFVPASVDLTGFDLGQFGMNFGMMMAETENDEMMATEEADMDTTEEAPADTTMMSDTVLVPGVVAGEDAECATLREEVEAYVIGEMSN